MFGGEEERTSRFMSGQQEDTLSGMLKVALLPTLGVDSSCIEPSMSLAS